MLKNCTESTECSLPWWPVSSLGEIPRGHLSDGIHTHALVTNSEQGLDKLTNPHSFEKMIESVRCEIHTTYATLRSTKSHELELEVLQFWTRCT